VRASHYFVVVSSELTLLITEQTQNGV